MVSDEQVREMVRDLPDTSEDPHFERAAFKVAGKIFATLLPGEHDLNLKLTADFQESLTTSKPEVFSPVKWGEQRIWTKAHLDKAEPAEIEDLLEEAWRLRAPRKLLAEFEKLGE